MLRLLRATVCAMLWLSAYPCWCTSHLFVLNKDGIWVASDSLVTHNDGRPPSTVCKVVKGNGRLLLMTGTFRDSDEILKAERRLRDLPGAFFAMDVDRILKKNVLMDGPGAGIIMLQVEDGQSLGLFLQVDGKGNPIHPYSYFAQAIEGVPHGTGPDEKTTKMIKTFHDEAQNDPLIRAKISKNPKDELLQMLKKVADADPADVGPPFTVFLLKLDGSITDFSAPDSKICE